MVICPVHSTVTFDPVELVRCEDSIANGHEVSHLKPRVLVLSYYKTILIIYVSSQRYCCRGSAQHKFQIQTDCSDCELLTGKLLNR